MYVILGWIALRQLAESRRLRELEYRPYVLVDFHFKGMFVALEVRNIGKNPARDVKIAFDQRIVPSDDRRVDFSVFDNPIPFMAPGRTIRLPLGSGPAFFSPERTAPLSHTVQCTYRDISGKVVYEDPALVLDLGPYKHTAPPMDPTADIAKAAKEISKTLDKWTSFRGLTVVATDSLRATKIERRNDARWEARHAYRDEGVRGLWRFAVRRMKERRG